ncbi:MAG: beta-N-acetylhexosaminidase [Bdellovibrionaceae bacterium]|nr:beta-N-acetylhexosaminidase [Pseudobdellovibrionaceae bacterium]
MFVENKIGQLFIIGISGTTLREDEAEFIVKNNIGGIILFDRNIESPEQLHALCASINALKEKTPEKLPPFISIDMEGGRVARLKKPFTTWPPLKQLGNIDSTSLAFNFAMAMGEELSAMGINLDYAPCTDVLTNPKNEIIGDRAISTDPEQVSKIASALVRGYIKGNVIPCAKHFPGHGNTLLDSHFDLPVEDDVDLETLKNRELVPFKKVFRARLDMVMTAHILYPKVDKDNPATFSSIILKDLLRDDLKYRGLVISDDLDMKAIRNHHEVADIPIKALNAGCDILLYCNEPTSPMIAMDAIKKALANNELNTDELMESYQRVIKVKQNKLASLKQLPLDEALSFVGKVEHKELSSAIAEGRVPEEP